MSGHNCILHACVVGGFVDEQSQSLTGAHALLVQITFLVCVQPPHCAEHNDRSQVSRWYTSTGSGTVCVGHVCVLHGWVVAGFGCIQKLSATSSQLLSLHCTFLDCIPHPQIAEHEDRSHVSRA